MKLIFSKKKTVLLNSFFKKNVQKKLLRKPVIFGSAETDPSASVGDCYYTAVVCI